MPALPAAAQLMAPSPAAQHGPASVGQPQAFALSPGLQQDLDAPSSAKQHQALLSALTAKQQQPLFPSVGGSPAASNAGNGKTAGGSSSARGIAARGMRQWGPLPVANSGFLQQTCLATPRRLSLAVACHGAARDGRRAWRSRPPAARRQQGPAASAQTDAMRDAAASPVQSWAARLRSSAAASSATAASATLQLPQPATPSAQQTGHKVYRVGLTSMVRRYLYVRDEDELLKEMPESHPPSCSRGRRD